LAIRNDRRDTVVGGTVCMASYITKLNSSKNGVKGLSDTGRMPMRWWHLSACVLVSMAPMNHDSNNYDINPPLDTEPRYFRLCKQSIKMQLVTEPDAGRGMMS
jgi:hypothetical protein